MSASLVDRLRDAVGELQLTEAEMRRALQIADDVAELTVRELSGEDVEQELEFARASAENIVAAHSVTAGRVLADAVRGFLLELALRWTRIA